MTVDSNTKRGQITSFIIVGIVLLFLLAFTVYITFIIAGKQPIIDVAPEKGNLRACLEQATELALLEIGKQGGTTAGLTNNAVQSYSIGSTQTMLIRNAVYACTPPSPGTYTPGTSQTGVINLEPLCLLRGPNRPNAGLDYRNDCLAGTYQTFELDNQVLQYELQQLISSNIQSCGLNGTVSVTIGGDDLTISANNISIRVSARLKRVYNAAFNVALSEAKDLFFDQTNVNSLAGCAEPNAGNECILPGITVNTGQDFDAEVTIVEVIDSTKKIQGAPFIFRYAVENRPPAITTITDATNTPTRIMPSAGITSNSNEDVVIDVETIDPDEMDTLYVACCGPSWATCTTSVTGNKATTTISMNGCSNEPSGESSAIGIQASDGSWYSNFFLPVHLEPIVDECPEPGTSATIPSCQYPLGSYVASAQVCSQNTVTTGTALVPYTPPDPAAPPAPPLTCIQDGQLDLTPYNSKCCSGRVVRGSMVCPTPGTYGTTWTGCTQICGRGSSCPYGPTGTQWCPCPAGTVWNGSYVPDSCQ